MKKSVIMAGISSCVVATLPVVSVFGATGTTVTDTIEVTVGSSCLITVTSTSNTYSVTMTNGSLNSNIGNTAMTINCNDAAGWKVTAVADGTGSPKSSMVPSGSGTAIATGTATSGGTSNWAFKVTGTKASGYTSFKAIPTTAATVATNAGSSAGESLTATYRVWISATQQADTYTGKVKYTLAHPAS